MQNIVNYLRGFSEISFNGAFPERFLNICARNNVELWKLERQEGGGYTARMRTHNVRKLNALAERSMCTAEVRGKRGAPSFAGRFLGRYLFIAGMAACIIFAMVMSQRVWDFEVAGNERVSSDLILKHLRALGVTSGVKISGIDPDALEDEMLVRIPDLLWFTVNCNGSIATVEVRERVLKPVMIDEKQPSNIVARKAGVIEKIAVLEGSAQAAVGDTVEQGQLLASGIVDTASGIRVVHAMADVTAKTWYTLQAAAPLEAVFKLSSGKETVKRAIIIGEKRVNFHFSSSIYPPECDKIVTRTRLSLPGGLKLPLEWEKSIITPYSQSPSEQDGEDLENALKSQLLERLETESGGAEVVDTQFEFEERGGMLFAKLIATCREEISQSADIPFDTAIFGW